MTTTISLSGLFGRSVTRGRAPKNTAIFQVPLDFSVDLILQFSANFTEQIQNTTGIAGIQSVMVDNSLNSNILVFTFGNGVKLYVPPFTQGIFPIFYDGNTLSFTAVSQDAVMCSITFLNTREQAQSWSANTPISGTINVTGSTVYAQKLPGSLADHSATIAVGGTSQLAVAADPTRRTLAIRNPATPASQGIAAAEPVYVSFGAGAVVGALGTWELLPGEQLPLFDTTPTDAVYINAATAGHRVTIKTD